jgi:hypothetical protein
VATLPGGSLNHLQEVMNFAKVLTADDPPNGVRRGRPKT